MLVHELLCLELWREKVFPLMLESSAHPTSGFPAYLVVNTPPPLAPQILLMYHNTNNLQLYTEGTVASLLETSLFYQVLIGVVLLVTTLYHKHDFRSAVRWVGRVCWTW